MLLFSSHLQDEFEKIFYIKPDKFQALDFISSFTIAINT